MVHTRRKLRSTPTYKSSGIQKFPLGKQRKRSNLGMNKKSNRVAKKIEPKSSNPIEETRSPVESGSADKVSPAKTSGKSIKVTTDLHSPTQQIICQDKPYINFEPCLKPINPKTLHLTRRSPSLLNLKPVSFKSRSLTNADNNLQRNKRAPENCTTNWFHTAIQDKWSKIFSTKLKSSAEVVCIN